MPHNELCPACGAFLSDWHWEWHDQENYVSIYKGGAAMECPLCGAAVSYAGGNVPLVPAPPDIPAAKRVVLKASTWARVSNTGMSLEDYLGTPAGQPYANLWNLLEVQRADRQTAATP